MMDNYKEIKQMDTIDFLNYEKEQLQEKIQKTMNTQDYSTYRNLMRVYTELIGTIQRQEELNKINK